MNLFKAHDQWMTRPADQRFSNLKEMHAAVNGYRQTAKEGIVRQGDVKIAPTEGGIALLGKSGTPAVMTHWAFDQLATRVAYPAAALRSLSPELACQVLNYCIKDDDRDDAEIALLLHGNGEKDNGLIARALTSTKYARIWNADVIKRLMELPGGWRVPPARPAFPDQPGTRPATKEDIVDTREFGLSVKVGDLIAPAGLYASDHDMFAFMVNEENRIKLNGSKHGLARGFFSWNSEVGASSFGLMSFLYDFACGNHIVWDVQNVTETRVRHVGKANDRAFDGLEATVIKYANDSASDEEKRIREAQRFKLGKDKDAVLDAIFKFGIGGLSKPVVKASYDLAEQYSDVHGDPRTVWGMVSGITRYSQLEGAEFAQDRMFLDRAAGELLQVAF